ncbi:MAG: hypothetical protein Q9186_003921 [Xanthomendoza sp. 1 TL-2023]
MADYTFGGTDEENAELKKLNTEVLEDQDSFENWEKLVRAAEALEGGLNRNSSPQSIVATRDIYDRFLAKFPLLFGYWKKYADLEFSIAGTEAAELVYERGVASITNSVDLWTNYCSFKVETSHDPDVIRELFERGATSVGLDFLAHPFWDKYLEFEERLEAQDKIFAILDRVVHIPMHQYARYFERYRHLAQHRPLPELLPADMLSQFRSDIENESPATVPGGAQQVKVERGELEIEREMRTRIDNFHLEIFARTQTETTKRWTYESEIKRPYFHVTELDESQMVNWRKYLDFEEVEGDYSRTQFLYERCLVTCAYNDEFWLRYARWMLAQPSKEEEVRNIYQRASMLYVPISRPAVRLHYAYFEEMCDRIELAKDIHQAVLINLPGHIETIVSLANLSRRHGGLEAAIEVYKAQIESAQCDHYAKAALCAEWARLLWKTKGSVDEARKVFQQNSHWYLDSRPFWISYLFFELEQATSAETEATQYKHIKQVHDDIRRKSQLPPLTIKDLSHYYMAYLLERGTKGAAKEYMTLDREVNGPFSVQSTTKQKLAEDGREASTQRRMMMENGHPGVEIDEAAIRRGENPYTKYYQLQGEQQLPSDTQPRSRRDVLVMDLEPSSYLTGHPRFPSRIPKGVLMPSGTSPPGQSSKFKKEVNAASENPSTAIANTTRNQERQPNFALSTLLETKDLADPSRYALARQVGQGEEELMPSRLPHNHTLPEQSSDDEIQASSLLPYIAIQPRGDGITDAHQATKLCEPGTSRYQPTDLEPQDESSGQCYHSKIRPPKPGASEKDRRQAIIWLAQDVYEAAYPDVVEAPLREQLRVVTIFRNLAVHLEGEEGKKTIHDILMPELGEEGLALLRGPDKGDIFRVTG